MPAAGTSRDERGGKVPTSSPEAVRSWDATSRRSTVLHRGVVLCPGGGGLRVLEEGSWGARVVGVRWTRRDHRFAATCLGSSRWAPRAGQRHTSPGLRGAGGESTYRLNPTAIIPEKAKLWGQQNGRGCQGPGWGDRCAQSVVIYIFCYYFWPWQVDVPGPGGAT